MAASTSVSDRINGNDGVLSNSDTSELHLSTTCLTYRLSTDGIARLGHCCSQICQGEYWMPAWELVATSSSIPVMPGSSVLISAPRCWHVLSVA